jgi:hypothetical protein
VRRRFRKTPGHNSTLSRFHDIRWRAIKPNATRPAITAEAAVEAIGIGHCVSVGRRRDVMLGDDS